jgi:hypothetical protein
MNEYPCTSMVFLVFFDFVPAEERYTFISVREM